MEHDRVSSEGHEDMLCLRGHVGIEYSSGKEKGRKKEREQRAAR